MSVRFVIGRSGTGKTQRCFRAIVDLLRAEPLGPPVYWLLPKQATFMAERELTCGWGLPGFCRARVLSFDQLSHDVLAECGGAAVPEITPIGRQMILGHLLRQNQPKLRFFHKVARHAALAAKIDQAIAEFERCGKDPAQVELLLTDLSRQRNGADDLDTLTDKLHDLHLIYKAYSDYLGQERLDPRRRMEQVLRSIDDSKLFRGSAVFVDGFIDFDEFQRRVLAHIAKAAGSVEVMLPMDGRSPVLQARSGRPAEWSDLSLFHHVEDTCRRLMAAFRDAGVRVEKPQVLSEVRRFHASGLSQIEQELFESAAPSPAPAQGELFAPANLPAANDAPAEIELLEAPDKRAEVDAAARRIARHIASGLRFREIAILVRQLDEYQDYLNASFHEHGIPFFVDHRRTMGHHPLLQFLRCALLIAQQNWPHEAVMMLLKCGLAGLTSDEADALENYVLLHRIRRSAWVSEDPWTYKRHLTRPADDDAPAPEQVECEKMDALRKRVAERLAPFIAEVSAAGPQPIRRIVTAIYDLFDKFAIRQTLESWMAEARDRADLEQASEHEQVWIKLSELFQQMVELLGDEPAALEDFQEVLEAGLESFDLALAPQTLDQVLVGQVDRTRTPNVKAALVLGMNEGLFPYAPAESSLLSDAERVELRRRDFEVDPDTQRRLLDEDFLGYVALTRASHSLYVSRSIATDAGRPLGPSPFWRRLLALFPKLAVEVIPRDPRTAPELIGTPRQLLTGLMRWVRDPVGWAPPTMPKTVGGAHPTAEVAKSAWPALYQWLASHPPDGDPIDTLRYRVWKALGYANEARLSAETTRRLFTSPLDASVGQLESFAACPFQHFVRYGLRLEGREDDDPTAIDLDTIYHQVLDNLVRDMIQRGRDWTDLPAEEACRLIGAYAVEIGQTLRGELMMSSARNRYLLGHIERTLEGVVAAARAAGQRGNFHPGHAHVSFGGGGPRALPALEIGTPAGGKVALRGKIDRVDLLSGSGAAAVIDYRLGNKELSLARVYHGLSLRLLTYLLVIQAHGQKLAGRQLLPAAALHVRMLKRLGAVDHPSLAMGPDDPRFDLNDKPRGIVLDSHALDFDTKLQPGGKSDVLAMQMKRDGGFAKSSDTAGEEDFAALLKYVETTLGALADRIMKGEIAIRPYRMGTDSPCSKCDYKSICRFDPAMNHYRFISAMSREEVFERAKEEK